MIRTKEEILDKVKQTAKRTEQQYDANKFKYTVTTSLNNLQVQFDVDYSQFTGSNAAVLEAATEQAYNQLAKQIFLTENQHLLPNSDYFIAQIAYVLRQLENGRVIYFLHDRKPKAFLRDNVVSQPCAMMPDEELSISLVSLMIERDLILYVGYSHGDHSGTAYIYTRL